MGVLDLNGKVIDLDNYRNGNESLFITDFEKQVLAFLDFWYSDNREFTIHTSGSTGTPKPIHLFKDKICLSAQKTNEYFRLSEGDTIAAALPVNKVGGLMMIARALVGNYNLDLQTPTSKPVSLFEEGKSYQLISMTPHQLTCILNEVNFDKEQLNLSKNILLGGSGINQTILDGIQDLSTLVYLSYGMTETYSHIALKNIKEDDFFTTLKGIQISSNESNELIIQGDITNYKPLKTNDVVKIVGEGKFKYIGRNDNAINTGGLKVFPEELEEKVRKPFIKNLIFSDYLFMGIQDEILGEKLIFIIESVFRMKIKKNLTEIFKEHLKKHEIPKKIIFIDSLPRNQSNKVDRIALNNIIFDILEE